LVTNTLQELKFFGVKSSFALLDAGFYSSENITKLNEANLAFLTRLPSSRKIFKQLITEVAPTIEKAQNATKYNNRILFVKHQEVEIDDMHLNAYVILDPIRKQRETSKLLSNLLEDDLIDDNTDNALLSKGIFILISSDTIETTQVVPLYYKRQKVEELFGIAKDDIDILPLRIHSESTLRGYLLINFIALSIYVLLNTALGNKYRLEETLSIMRNLKCKIYNDNFLVSERTKQQREILEHLEIQHLENLVPKTPGI
jgi:transposase